MKIVIKIRYGNNIRFQLQHRTTCSLCECGHNVDVNEFYLGVRIPVNADYCERTTHFYKTFMRRMKLKIQGK